jgi:hypothetical protein
MQPIVPIYKKVDKTDWSNYQGYHCYQLHTKLYPIFFCQGLFHKYIKLLSIISVDVYITDQLLIIYSAFVRYWRRDENTMSQCIGYL